MYAGKDTRLLCSGPGIGGSGLARLQLGCHYKDAVLRAYWQG